MDRLWRVSPSGVEHVERPRNSESGGFWHRVAHLGAGHTLAYCGRDITSYKPAPARGRLKPCGNCLKGEAASDD